MQRKRKITLTILASLGLLAMGSPAVNAKSTNSNHQVKSASVSTMNVNHNHSNNDNSKVKSNQSISTDNVKSAKSTKPNNLNRPKNAKALNVSHLTKSDVKNVKPNKAKLIKWPKVSKGGLSYNHTALPNHPQKDHNHQFIGGMKKFIKMRKPYRYTMVNGNARDLGGYPTADHKRQTKVDRIIRSADLDGLSRSGVNALERLHVNQIVDLRYPNSRNGIQGHPDPDELRSKTLKGTGIVYQKDPIYSYGEAKKFAKYMKHHDIHGEYYFYGAPSVTEPQAIKAYGTVFNDLLNNNDGAILFHCNLGRDRTGTTSALILSALGVSRDEIFHDYLLTDHYHYNFHRQAYSKPAGELSYFFDTIDQKYGSVRNYLQSAIGLSNSDLQQLRSMYLVPANQKQFPIKLHRINNGDHLKKTASVKHAVKKADHPNQK